MLLKKRSLKISLNSLQRNKKKKIYVSKGNIKFERQRVQTVLYQRTKVCGNERRNKQEVMIDERKWIF